MHGKVLIVTGSTGIGAAAARMAAERGARVLIATADGATGWELAQETGAECWTGELTRPAAADSVVSQCLARFGRIDALLYAAGAGGRRYGDGPVHECSDEGWNLALAQNLTAPFYLCRAVIGRMLQQEVAASGLRGAIVLISSVLAFAPEPREFSTHAYAAAKGALAAMSRSMAAYYAPHRIGVNSVAPGMVRTPAGQSAMDDPKLAEIVRGRQQLTGGLVDVQDVARTALYLAGEAAGSITGQMLNVDGGWSVLAG
jgi:NAD(P)-dependent dehydrogenase (short-subunit alcohol dehydrogenase family)